ncbi:MAG: glucuronate isomerase [Acidobacteriota bacterium]
MSFIHSEFLLDSRAARDLYHAFAEPLPIIDYHCHLSPRDLAENRRFADLSEIWLEGDHYKWRAMRANGVAEEFCTGSASPRDKFLAWARTVRACLRNPLYHWTHLELARYFRIHDLLDASTAPRIWEQAIERLASDDLSTHGILRKFNVEVVCTTDDPAEPLTHHERLAQSTVKTRILPTFRPDRALDVDQPDVFGPWVDRLASTANIDIAHCADLLDALDRRHQAFHDIGGRLSDHGLEQCFAAPCTDDQASAIFDRARAGRAASPDEHRAFASHLMRFFGRLDATRGWTKQLHLGARRNANTHASGHIGRDAGYDSIGDWPQAERLGQYLDQLAAEDTLPKTIVYNLNPADNYVFATMIGNFQDGKTAGKVQFGSGWWFLDQKEGMEWQMNALSNVGLLSRFVGMTTDSRSFMSYPRHEYFRRVLCNLLGRDMESGHIPNDRALVGPMVEAICHGNAQEYFGFRPRT